MGVGGAAWVAWLHGLHGFFSTFWSDIITMHSRTWMAWLYAHQCVAGTPDPGQGRMGQQEQAADAPLGECGVYDVTAVSVSWPLTCCSLIMEDDGPRVTEYLLTPAEREVVLLLVNGLFDRWVGGAASQGCGGR